MTKRSLMRLLEKLIGDEDNKDLIFHHAKDLHAYARQLERDVEDLLNTAETLLSMQPSWFIKETTYKKDFELYRKRHGLEGNYYIRNRIGELAPEAEGKVEVRRPEDMSPDGRLTLIRQDDGDIIVHVREDAPDHAQTEWREAAVEFCASGGRSHHTLRALRALFAAMAMDSEREHPRRFRPPQDRP